MIYDDFFQAILLGIGLQHKTIDELGAELILSVNQLLALFNRLIRCYLQFLNKTIEEPLKNVSISNKSVDTFAISESIDQELAETARKIQEVHKKEFKKLMNENLVQFAIKGSNEDWKNALAGKGEKNIISVKW